MREYTFILHTVMCVIHTHEQKAQSQIKHTHAQPTTHSNVSNGVDKKKFRQMLKWEILY